MSISLEDGTTVTQDVNNEENWQEMGKRSPCIWEAGVEGIPFKLIFRNNFLKKKARQLQTPFAKHAYIHLAPHISVKSTFIKHVLLPDAALYAGATDTKRYKL